MGFFAGLRPAGAVEGNPLQARGVAKLKLTFDRFDQQRRAALVVGDASAFRVPLHPSVRAACGGDK
jgi:hypothetical protein